LNLKPDSNAPAQGAGNTGISPEIQSTVILKPGSNAPAQGAGNTGISPEIQSTVILKPGSNASAQGAGNTVSEGKRPAPWTARAERPWMATSDFPQLTVFPEQAPNPQRVP